MQSEIKTYTYDNKEIQRVQMVSLDSWDNLQFFRPSYNKLAFDRLCSLYKTYIVKKFASFLGHVVIFTLPDDLEVPFDSFDSQYGTILDELAVVSVAFNRNTYVKDGKIEFKDSVTGKFFQNLKKNGYLNIAVGDRDEVSFVPVGKSLGFMSENLCDVSFKVNSSFFIMDKLDCGTVYDRVGTPLGLCKCSGKIENPPMFNREALLVNNNGSISVRKVSLKEAGVIIDKVTYWHKKNCLFYSRPDNTKTKRGGFDIVVVENKIVAVKKGGQTVIPSGGFVIHLDKEITIESPLVEYCGFDNVKFAVQVGNSAIIKGKPTKRFISPFYNCKNPLKTSFPPTMYPLGYNKDRAPRILIGDKDGKPVVLWCEGAGKFGYVPGKESCGTSLRESAIICKELGINNAVHLDGGGSAQILLSGKRQLCVSDRDKKTLEQVERAISIGLYC